MPAARPAPVKPGSSIPLARAVASLLAALLPLLLLVSSSCARRKPRARPAFTPPIGFTESGIASWYGVPYHGRRAANGEIFDMEKFTAAHRTFAFDTWVRVHNLDNGLHVDVRITDRGPFVRGRIIDLSRAAARSIDMIGPGLARVRLQVIPPPVQTPSPPLPTPTEGASSTPCGAPRFAVQVGAFRQRENAERLRISLSGRFGPARLIRREGSATPWRVLVGSENSQESATELAQQISREFGEAFVVRLDEKELQTIEKTK